MLKVTPGSRRTPDDLESHLIAPCGIDCALCMRYLRDRDVCHGCRAGDEGKAKSCIACAIRACDGLGDSATGFCFDCSRFPCPRLKRLDARYRARYRTSPVENLVAIRERGIEAFFETERMRSACPACGGLQCMHTPYCIYCGQPWPTSATPQDRRADDVG